MPRSARIIAGTVLDATGRPVAQARVFFSSAPGSVPDIAALTSADGRFQLNAPQPGKYQVSASSDTQGSANIAVEVGSQDADVVVKLVR
jgi:protocatechuate 3,4-dioxygenase beta subunit